MQAGFARRCVNPPIGMTMQGLGQQEPCTRILHCWAGRLPIVEFLKENYTQEVLEKVLAPPPSRLERIMSAAERVARNKASQR